VGIQRENRQLLMLLPVNHPISSVQLISSTGRLERCLAVAIDSGFARMPCSQLAWGLICQYKFAWGRL